MPEEIITWKLYEIIDFGGLDIYLKNGYRNARVWNT